MVLLLSSASIAASQELSFEAGAGYAAQQGHFIAPCGCTFAKGTGYDLQFHAAISLFSASDLSVGIGVGLQYQHITDVEVAIESFTPISNGDRQVSNLLYGTLDPYVRYSIPSVNLLLQLSPRISYILSKHFQHISPPGANDADEIPYNDIDIRHLKISLAAGVGYTFHLGQYTLTPMLGYELPLNTIRNDPTDYNWKITSIMGSVLLRYNL